MSENDKVLYQVPDVPFSRPRRVGSGEGSGEGSVSVRERICSSAGMDNSSSTRQQQNLLERRPDPGRAGCRSAWMGKGSSGKKTAEVSGPMGLVPAPRPPPTTLRIPVSAGDPGPPPPLPH